MKYALLAYGTPTSAEDADDRPIAPVIAALLARPEVEGWVRLRGPGSATTLRHGGAKTVLSDGPFIDSKEYLGGVVLIEAADLDEALAIAARFQEQRSLGAIEVRPILEATI